MLDFTVKELETISQMVDNAIKKDTNIANQNETLSSISNKICNHFEGY